MILSPYSGHPVKIREQDLGRALRDEQGRVFYVVEDPEHGRYAARTRKGSPKDLERYRALEIQTDQLHDNVQPTRDNLSQAHDAAGKTRRNPVGWLMLVLIAAALATAGYLYLNYPQWLGLDGQIAPIENDETENDQADSSPPSPAASLAPRIRLASSTPRTPHPSRQTQEHGYKDFRHTASGLRYQITHLTDGPPARAGNVLTIRYAASTLDGKPIINDASQTFILATGQAIRAFDEGLAGVREGEQLRLFVPRGHSDQGTLPGIDRVPDQPFLLDIQLLSVRPGVSYITEKPGLPDSRPAMPGDTVDLHYLAQIEGQEQVIDTTVHRGKPFRLTLGNNEVIPGLELGITGMRQGESRHITIPPYLAYGKYSVAGGLIPENAVLSFRVTLVHIVEDDQ